ncbi:hypothetical protein QQF64_031476 [Cirrhinus molitorella]|uniref:Uncharacterized protein n=1 Tax=Cirrhinus molitorella TaxID=172907 RepID=A0ABR3MX53_9TELE
MANSANLSTPASEHESHNIGAQEHTDEIGTWDDIFRFEDDYHWSTGLDSSEWEVSDFEDGTDTGGEKQNTDKIRMFKLQRILDQLDIFYQQKKLNVLQAREELKAFQLHVTNLEELRDKIEVDIEREKQAENSVALFRLCAQHKRVCAELQVEEDLGAHLAMILKEHELELCQVEVELGRFSSLRQQLELEEKNVRSQDKKKQKLRLQREKNVIKERRLKAQQDKIESDKALQKEVDVHTKQQEQSLASKAAVYFKQTLQRMKQKEAEAEERRKELIKKRQTAVMTLKASFAATQETMCARKKRQKAYEQKQKEQEQHMRESLEAKGLNSTELIHRLRLQQHFNRKIVPQRVKGRNGVPSSRALACFQMLLNRNRLESRREVEQRQNRGWMEGQVPEERD